MRDERRGGKGNPLKRDGSIDVTRLIFRTLRRASFLPDDPRVHHKDPHKCHTFHPFPDAGAKTNLCVKHYNKKTTSSDFFIFIYYTCQL